MKPNKLTFHFSLPFFGIGLGTAFFSSTVFLGCGVLAGNNGGSSNNTNSTLDALAKSGLPAWETLVPELPSEVFQLKGINTNAQGLAQKPEVSANANLLGAVLPAEYAGALDEAKSLSLQGFSEAARVTSFLTNYIKPAYDLVSVSNILKSVSSLGGQNLSSTFSAQISPWAGQIPNINRLGALNDIGTSLFKTLLSNATFSVELPVKTGFPSHLVLGAKGQEVTIETLWPTNVSGSSNGAGVGPGKFETGVIFKLSNFAESTKKIGVAVAAKSIAGLVPGWKAQGCADDLYEISFGFGSNSNSMSISSWECPSGKNSLSQFSIEKNTQGLLKVTGAFAQNFDVAGKTGIRASLGSRQGVLLSAVGNTTGEFKMAAAGALLGEKDFAKSSSEVLGNFGVAQVATRYVGFEMNKNKGTSGTTSSYLCYSQSIPFVGSIGVPSVSTDINALCGGNGENVDSESLLAQASSAKSSVSGWTSYLPGDYGAKINEPLNTLVDILNIRNTMYVGKNTIAYKTAPDAQFTELNKSLLGTSSETFSLATLQSPSAEFKAKFRTLDTVPKVEFGSSLSEYNDFLGAACRNLLGKTAEKAGKSSPSGC